MLVNAATRAELDAGLAAGAEGVGLLRTELAFLEAPALADRGGAPRRARAACSPASPAAPPPCACSTSAATRPRPSWPARAARGLALLLAHPEALAAQLRAIVDAGRGTELRVLLPMVESAERGRARCRALLPAARPPLGAMIETRRGGRARRRVAAAADFLSIGTNDLRTPSLGSRPLRRRRRRRPRPARARRDRADGARRARSRHACVEVCGEAASDPVSLPLLVGLGVDELSVGAARVGAVRGWVRALDHAARGAATPRRGPGDEAAGAARRSAAR